MGVRGWRKVDDAWKRVEDGCERVEEEWRRKGGPESEARRA